MSDNNDNFKLFTITKLAVITQWKNTHLVFPRAKVLRHPLPLELGERKMSNKPVNLTSI
jgi:hypothetical protein